MRIEQIPENADRGQVRDAVRALIEVQNGTQIDRPEWSNSITITDDGVPEGTVKEMLIPSNMFLLIKRTRGWELIERSELGEPNE